ncbi:hypothetical protein [Daejeonella oryzae]|uniref:hypothetical protein n=1 Tax=Daejeonella oryzae TaxID=1122943 RepID=UPI0004144497|nr:hypothetical protein [Daejeonella oryzae]
MTPNYLKKHIESLFSEMTHLTANLNVLETFIVERGTQLNTNFPFPDYEIISMMSTYRDLSQLQGGNNLYNTNVSYSLSTNNINSEVDRLNSYLACLTVTQSFEVFESYLKNILTEIIFNNKALLVILNLNIDQNDFNGIREKIFLLQGKSNKGFIKALRKISPFFTNHEINNIWQRNMSHWFELIAKVRDLVVHSRLIINPQFSNYIQEPHRLKLFNLHFTITEQNGTKKLSLTAYQANAIISYLFEYAHLIYKGLSQDFNLGLNSPFKSVEL